VTLDPPCRLRGVEPGVSKTTHRRKQPAEPSGPEVRTDLETRDTREKLGTANGQTAERVGLAAQSEAVVVRSAPYRGLRLAIVVHHILIADEASLPGLKLDAKGAQDREPRETGAAPGWQPRPGSAELQRHVAAALIRHVAQDAMRCNLTRCLGSFPQPGLAGRPAKACLPTYSIPPG
jgi:hypothetical protein